MLVQFSCGCVGFADGTDRPVIINRCDLDGDACWEPYGFDRRDMSDKTHEPLPAEKVEEVWTALARLVNDGYKFRQIRNLLAP